MGVCSCNPIIVLQILTPIDPPAKRLSGHFPHFVAGRNLGPDWLSVWIDFGGVVGVGGIGLGLPVLG